MFPLTKQLCAAACALLCLLPSIVAACDACRVSQEIRVESPLEAEWSYPAAREQHRAAFAWARALRDDESTATIALVTDAATSGTISRRMAALLAAREAGVSIAQSTEQYAEITSAAMLLAKDDILGWGAEALWRDHVPAFRSMEHPSLPDFLIAQLGEDGIMNNATRGADLLRLGMIEDSTRYTDALAAWWRTHPVAQDAEMPQASLMIGSLLLLQASLDTETFGDVSETWGSLALNDRTGDLGGWRALSPEAQATVLEVAYRFSSRGWYPEYFLDVVAGCARRRAWSILTRSTPLAEEQLLTMMASERHSRFDRLRATVVLLTRDPEVLATPRGLDSFTEVAAMDYWLANSSWELLQRHEGMATEEESCWGVSDSWLLHECFDASDAIPPPFPEATMRSVREKIVAHLRVALANEVEPRRQIGLWSFLLTAEDVPSHPVIAQAAVSNFVADDEVGNATDATRALERVGTEGIRAAQAGLRVAVEVGDWQLASKCADFLEANDPEFQKSAHPQVMALMARQLLDDEVEGNGAAAMRYLGGCGDAARPYLLAIVDSGDEQGARYAGRLLGE